MIVVITSIAVRERRDPGKIGRDLRLVIVVDQKECAISVRRSLN
jgi:hypothetical protein